FFRRWCKDRRFFFHASLASSRDNLFRKPANADQLIDAELRHLFARFAMKLGTRLAKFKHFAGNYDLTTVLLISTHRRDHFKKRARIGIVGIIDESESTSKNHHLATHSGRRGFSQRRGNFLKRRFVEISNRSSSERVVNVMTS